MFHGPWRPYWDINIIAKLRKSFIPAKLSTPSISVKPRRSLVPIKAKYFHGSKKVKWFPKKKNN